MTQAALPNYMQKHLANQDIAPGHRFGLYFPVWQDDWRKADGEKTTVLKKVTTLPENSRKLAENLQKRQQALALQNPQIAYFPAKSISPFMTGMGNEHPLENGFAFLNPYGLPYLPGSSVKGVLRTAAEQLALGLYGETGGWDMLSVWWLFGFEASGSMFESKPYKIDVLDEEAQRRQQAYQDWLNIGDYDQDTLNCLINIIVENKDRKKYLDQPQSFLNDLISKKSLRENISNQGSLRFWDVYPQSKNLSVGILTPHHGGYFNGRNAPHDSESPIPNVFLTIPPNSFFHFYCACASARLPEALQTKWQTLIESAFKYAFEWLGFGAKTVVGYGQMNQDDDTRNNWTKQKEQIQQEQELEKGLSEYSPMAQDFMRKMNAGKWFEDKDAFLRGSDIDNWLPTLADTPDKYIIEKLIQLFNEHYPDLLLNPDKVQGKKQTPVFKDKQRKWARDLNALKTRNLE
jgi:CRISPR-associated protein Cmr6